MKFLIRFILFVSLPVILSFSSPLLAIEPLTNEPPPEVPADAEIQQAQEKVVAPEVSPEVTNLTVERIHPQEIKADEEAEIILKITNQSGRKVDLAVTEVHKPGLAYPDAIEIKKRQFEALTVSYYLWQLSLARGQETEVKYHIEPQKVGMILFSPAIINDQYGNTFESAPTTLTITCRSNNKCDAGENYIFCPEDCPPGSADGVCDGITDDRCDPDCVKGADPDCAKNYFKLFVIIGIIIVVILVLLSLTRKLKRK